MDTTTALTPALQKHADRAQRLQNIADGYEVYGEHMPDATTPGADKPRFSTYGANLGTPPERVLSYHPRFVLVTQYDGNYRLHLGKDLRNIEQLAAHLVTDEAGVEQPICYFDLDVLAGEEPGPREGDRVTYDRAEDPEHVYYITAAQDDTVEGEYKERFYLDDDPDAFLSAEYQDAYDWNLTVVETDTEDTRMPVRYGLAKIVTFVAFNSEPVER